jgi:release factor glutamine methyltransferase
VTVREALAGAERRLAEAGVETPRVDAELLLAHLTGRSRTEIQADTKLEVDTATLEPLLRRREAREPLAYVLGEWGFRRLTVKTDARALVPRPETEILVERALALIGDQAEPRVLDIGVGSGAIALAIADEHPGARVTGVDTSRDALELARENAERLGLGVELLESGIETAAEGWDLVVSNPPYVRPHEWDGLQPEIHDWEPRGALVGEDVHAEIARAARTRALALEVGDDHALDVAGELAALGYTRIRITRDLTDRERVVEGVR